jgi:glycosyltransferase domain-containing protein
MQKAGLTIVIPTHNRHNYLERVLDYYSNSSYFIIVADSSENKYSGIIPDERVNYLHLPGLSLPQKLSVIFQKVTTAFMAMCADDDFVIPESLEMCVSFLKGNPDYSVAGGNILCYKKSDFLAGHIKFAVVFPQWLSYEIRNKDAWRRLDDFFDQYREIFYSVHRTENLRLAFEDVDNRITKVYLNEYLTVVLPIFRGNYKLLPILYQVREELESGGDRIAPNIDAIFSDKSYKNEYEQFISFQAEKISALNGESELSVRQRLDQILKNFAEKLKSDRAVVPMPGFDKKLGVLVKFLPLLGPWLIGKYREAKRKKNLQPYLQGTNDAAHLETIASIIKKYPIS